MSDCLSLRERIFAPGADLARDREWLVHAQVCLECRRAQQALPFADYALAEVARQATEVPSFDAIADVATSVARNQRRRVTMRRAAPFFYTALGAAALAAGVALVLFVNGGRRAAPLRLTPGTEIQASGESKSAILDTGARIRLDTGAIRLAPTSEGKQSLVLRSGRVFIDVPKLPAGKTLSVVTPDAEVRVHGTRFQVTRTAQETQVYVQQGVVEVLPEGSGRASRTVRAGESVTVPSVEVYREEVRHSALEALDRGQFDAAEKQIGQLFGTDTDSAQRAESHALLAWSFSGRGKRDEAIERYRQALKLLPANQRPLWAENACAELALLLQQKSSKHGVTAWAECLRRFPEGVHAGLARSRVNSTR
jgi:ferric-dicitrate binding protein FerR (iron transport regulator)